MTQITRVTPELTSWPSTRPSKIVLGLMRCKCPFSVVRQLPQPMRIAVKQRVEAAASM